MNTTQANRIPIPEYLASQGIYPDKKYPGYLMYRTPWREEKQPSMKVSLKENLWVDYGNGNEGGTLLDLVLRLHPQQTVSEALQHIYSARHSFSFQKHDSPIPFKETSGIQIESIKSIGTNRQLNQYLQDRGIDLKLADKFCSEVYFKAGGKSYFGIGHENENGWSIRNKFWKGCSAQGITLHRTGSRQVAVFEGIFDMLSYKQLASYSSRQSDLLILNSTSNLEKGMKVLEGYEKINLFLDNDRSGNEATQKIMEAYPFSKDKRWIYSGYKDFNDLLVSKATRERKLGNAQEASHVLVRPKRLLP
jgi:hypothetical protein